MVLWVKINQWDYGEELARLQNNYEEIQKVTARHASKNKWVLEYDTNSFTLSV